MPPKRKRGGAAVKGAGGKKAKKEVEEPTTSPPKTEKDAMDALKAADKGKKKGKSKVDANFPYAAGEIHEDFDCMLNQTNIGHNNNKYYVIQVVKVGAKYYAWNRWGRVGESGMSAVKGPFASPDPAIKDFEKKFKDKTRNNWANRENFSPSAGKYTLLEMDAGSDEDDDEEKLAKLNALDETDGPPKKVVPCTLDKATQALMKLIFDNDMFCDAMKEMEIDVKKMPLGKLSKSQIAKGFDVLEELEAAIKTSKRNQLNTLSSKFYTLIPHDFGRQRPPIMTTLESVRKKKDMLLVLADIELAQSMQKEDKAKAKGKGKGKVEIEEVPHPFDINYELLKCQLKPMDKKSSEFKLIEKYTEATKGGWNNPKILEVWEVDRETEGDRFSAHSKLDNRKLLWHGTNVAVVAAILKSGLRIMPHSGGRVGSGIYFASENGKSAGYVRQAAGGIGIMFLVEAALGKEHQIKKDDWTLKAAPKGYDSIVAKGRTEPDPKQDKTLTLDGKKIVVPQGKPINQAAFNDSYFSQSEYLVYKESQARIRYLLKMKF